jgi:hypothetical protein
MIILWAGIAQNSMSYGLGSWGSIPSRAKSFLSASQHCDQLWGPPSNLHLPHMLYSVLFCIMMMHRLPILGVFSMAGDYYEIHHYRNIPTEITEQVKKLLPDSPEIHVEPTPLFSTVKKINLCYSCICS